MQPPIVWPRASHNSPTVSQIAATKIQFGPLLMAILPVIISQMFAEFVDGRTCVAG